MSTPRAMPGWRMDFAAGDKALFGAPTRIKSCLGRGASPRRRRSPPTPDRPQECIGEIRAIGKSRCDAPVGAMGRAGFPIPAPPAPMFAGAIPPDAGFREYDQGFTRIGLAENGQRTGQAARNIAKLTRNADEVVARHQQMRNPEP